MAMFILVVYFHVKRSTENKCTNTLMKWVKFSILLVFMVIKISISILTEFSKGNYGVDFLASGDDLYSLEINLRITGTTHPNMTLRLLIDGEYKDGIYISKKSGKEKVYIASDNVKNEHFKNFQSDEIIELISKSKFHFDNDSETGTVLHMINAIPEHCKLGVTCIHNSVKEAKKLYEETVEFLDAEAKKASECF